MDETRQETWWIKPAREENEHYDFYAGIKAGGKLTTSIKNAEKSIKIVSPFLGRKEVERLRDKTFEGVQDIMIITRCDEFPAVNLHHVSALRKLILRKRRGDVCEYISIFNSVFFKGTFLHEKLYIIDDKIAYAGSFNFTLKGMETSHETCFTFKDLHVIDELIRYFNDLFAANLNKWSVSELGKHIYNLKEKKNGRQ